jgi:peptidyl-prolyl cis-trans isomerase SurA
MKTHFILSSFTVPLVTLLFSLNCSAKIIEKVLAVVNGETITLTEIAEYQTKLKTGGFLDDLLFSDPQERKKASTDESYLLNKLVDEKIIDFEVKQNGFLVTEERVDKEIATIAERQNMTISQLRHTLEGQSVNFLEYRAFVKKSIERRQLIEKEITSKIKISEQDIISHYLANNNSGKTQVFEYSLAHILFNKKNEAKANEVAQNLKGGASFDKLVKEFSVDEESREKLGKFGDFKSGEMVNSIQKAIEKIKIGETSSVVATPMGLHIFKVLDKKLVKDPEIEKQKNAIYQQLFSQAFKEQLDFWLLQKRKDAIIQMNKA